MVTFYLVSVGKVKDPSEDFGEDAPGRLRSRRPGVLPGFRVSGVPWVNTIAEH